MKKLWKWFRRILLVSMVLVLGLCLFGAIYHPWKTAQTERKYPPPGSLIDVGGHKLHYVVKGQGTPVVVIDAGMGEASYDWTHIQNEIAEFATVVCFDRAGHGWSECGPPPRTSNRNVEELRALLTNARLSPPYVLCGHSYGGLNMRLFASLYPEPSEQAKRYPSFTTGRRPTHRWTDGLRAAPGLIHYVIHYPWESLRNPARFWKRSLSQGGQLWRRNKIVTGHLERPDGDRMRPPAWTS